MSHKVTILIPTYNRAKYLPVAIRSALGQTHADLDILVLDDESPDNTPDVMRADETLRDPRVRYVRHKKNKGIAENWRYGFENAEGDFLCILHDDDTFAPDFVEKLIAPLLADTTLIFSFCDHWETDADGTHLVRESDENTRRFHRDTLPAGPVANLPKVALVDLSVPIGATLFRRSMISPDFISREAQGAIDIWLEYQCVRSGGGAYYVPERLMNYRVHGANMSATMPLHMGEGQLYRQAAILADPTMAGIGDEIRDQQQETRAGVGIALLRLGRRAEARQMLGQALAAGKSKRILAAYALAGAGPVGTQIAKRMRSGSN